MSILEQLSSAVGDRTEESNREVTSLCLADPSLLQEINEGLQGANAALLGDCAEVFTMVAESNPEWVAPFAENLIPLLSHKKNRVRWESAHALALVAQLVPQIITPILPQLQTMVQQDKSTIVRDYIVTLFGNYAASGAIAAAKVYPLLLQARRLWNEKHIKLILQALLKLVERLPSRAEEIEEIAELYLNHKSGVVRKAAKQLFKAIHNLLGCEKASSSQI